MREPGDRKCKGPEARVWGESGELQGVLMWLEWSKERMAKKKAMARAAGGHWLFLTVGWEPRRVWSRNYVMCLARTAVRRTGRGQRGELEAAVAEDSGERYDW
jgi:hypothetical protein